MLNRPRGKCTNSNDASKVCATENCRNHSLLCSDSHCSCQPAHQRCLIQLPFNKLIDQILKKDTTGLDCFNSLLDFCDYGIKQFMIQKDFILKVIDDGGAFLEKCEKKLIHSLKTQSSANLNGDLLSKVTQSLIRDPHINTQLVEARIDQLIKRNTESLHNILKQIVDSISFKQHIQLPLSLVESSELTLSKTLVSPDIVFVSKQRIKLLQQSSSLYHYALLQPGLDQIAGNEITIGLKIIQKLYMKYGVSTKQHMEDSGFICKHNSDDGHFVDYAAKSFSSVEEQNKVVHEELVGFDKKGDVIHLRYNKERQELRIENVNNGKQVTLKAPKRGKESFYFSIGMSNFCGYSPEIEFMGVIGTK